MLENCVLTILELNWNQRLGHKKTRINICHHMLASSTQLQNRSFHVAERTRTSAKCQKMKYARAKRAKILFFTVKYANLWVFCCPRRRGCLSSPMTVYFTLKNKSIFLRVPFYSPSKFIELLAVWNWINSDYRTLEKWNIIRNLPLKS